jgi:two-component system sensor kinase FixL
MGDTSIIEELKEKVLRLSKEIAELAGVDNALRQSEEKYKKLVENSLTGIYMDQGGKIVFFNDRFADIYGYPREELMGMETWRLVHPGDRELTDEYRAKRLGGKDVPSEYTARGLTREGETIWVKRRNTNIEYEGKPAILGNVVDVTEQKRAEEELRKTNEELRDFVRVVSHDLKSPLISIRGFSDRLRRNYADKMGHKGREYLERIISSAARMESLVSDLLSFSRIGRVVPTVERHSSLDIAKDVIADLNDRLKKNGVEVTVADGLPDISCDRERLYQVFQNLIVNAIKFTRPKEAPKIKIGYEEKGEFHQFYVKDNGIGIDPRDHRKIFEKFERLQEGGKEEGTGLGLAIVERIVTSHGGQVWVESEKGKGATFYFTLAKEPQVDKCVFPNIET